MSKKQPATPYPLGVGASPDGRIAFRKFVAFIQNFWSDETKFPFVSRGSKVKSDGEWLGVRRVFRGREQIALRPVVLDQWVSDKIVAWDVKTQLRDRGILIPGGGGKYTSQVKIFEGDERLRLLVLDLQNIRDHEHQRLPTKARRSEGQGS